MKAINGKLEKPDKETIPKTALLEVSVSIDPDLWAELEAQGWKDKDFEDAIRKAITIREASRSKPVCDIIDVDLKKYY